MILLKAIEDRRPKQLRLLLEAGVNVDTADRNGVTALMSVSALNNSSARRRLAKILLSYGPDCNKKDKNGQTALSWACRCGRDDVIHLILKSRHGADLDFWSDDNEGKSCLYLAASSGNCKALRQILNCMSKVCGRVGLHRPDNKGCTPLVEAFCRGHDDCVKILIKEASASVIDIIKYLERQEDSNHLKRLIRDINRFKKNKVASDRANGALPSNRASLQERDVAEYFLFHTEPVGCKLPRLEKSKLVSKRDEKPSKHKERQKPVAKGSENWTVKLFSLYAEQYSSSFVKESFPLIQRVPTVRPEEMSPRELSQRHGPSRKSSQTSCTTRYSSFIPPLLEAGEHKQDEARRKKSVRKTNTQPHIDVAFSSRRKRSNTFQDKILI